MTLILCCLKGTRTMHHTCLPRFQRSILKYSGNITSRGFKQNLQQSYVQSLVITKAPTVSKIQSFLGVISNQVRKSSIRRFDSEQVLYTNGNLKFLRLANIFGYCFSTYWLFTSYEYAMMQISVSNSSLADLFPWLVHFDVVNSPSRKIVFSSLTAFLGISLICGIWTFSLRSVGKLILGKDSKTVTFITFNPITFRMSRALTVSVDNVSCRGSRLYDDTVPIKVKGKWMHFLLMKDGTYTNGALFDKTVGLRRSF